MTSQETIRVFEKLTKFASKKMWRQLILKVIFLCCRNYFWKLKNERWLDQIVEDTPLLFLTIQVIVCILLLRVISDATPADLQTRTWILQSHLWCDTCWPADTDLDSSESSLVRHLLTYRHGPGFFRVISGATPADLQIQTWIPQSHLWCDTCWPADTNLDSLESPLVRQLLTYRHRSGFLRVTSSVTPADLQTQTWILQSHLQYNTYWPIDGYPFSRIYLIRVLYNTHSVNGGIQTQYQACHCTVFTLIVSVSTMQVEHG